MGIFHHKNIPYKGLFTHVHQGISRNMNLLFFNDIFVHVQSTSGPNFRSLSNQKNILSTIDFMSEFGRVLMKKK